VTGKFGVKDHWNSGKTVEMEKNKQGKWQKCRRALRATETKKTARISLDNTRGDSSIKTKHERIKGLGM